ncbi:MAG: ATP-binding protein [Neisseriaceae bacterium]
MQTNELKKPLSLKAKLSELVERLDLLLPPKNQAPNWDAFAYKWKRFGFRGVLLALEMPNTFGLERLVNIDKQVRLLVRNTEQFLNGYTANNVLLTGARGTGKSSLVKALLHDYADQGLRLVEVDKSGLLSLPYLLSLLRVRPEKYILFCDDLSFDLGESEYKELKIALDGSLSTKADNVLVYATSNRRHLMPQLHIDNLVSQNHDEAEIHPAEAIEEKTSLSDRFGLWLSFHPFNQEQYLAAVESWLKAFAVVFSDAARQEALRWAQHKGGRSGRVAWQFVCDWAGRQKLAAERETLK